jgi:hypothetical protein
MNKQQTLEKITQIENQTKNIKTILKDQANHIGRYHKALKKINEQLTYIKQKLMNPNLKGETK